MRAARSISSVAARKHKRSRLENIARFRPKYNLHGGSPGAIRKEGYPVNEEDKARLSPLIHEHINTQGRHSFVMPEAVVKGELHPLRNPADDPD
jgi:hypothetical protein